MVCFSPVGYGVSVWLTFRALALRRSRLTMQYTMQDGRALRLCIIFGIFASYPTLSNVISK